MMPANITIDEEWLKIFIDERLSNLGVIPPLEESQDKLNCEHVTDGLSYVLGKSTGVKLPQIRRPPHNFKCKKIGDLDMNKELIEARNNLDYWVTEAKKIIYMIDDDDDIAAALTVAAYVRNFYVQGKADAHWECHNSAR